MIIEAGFALCAANLSILYGMFKTNGLQKLKDSIHSLLSLHKPSHAHSIGSQRYRERLGSQGSDPRLTTDAAGMNRGKADVELLPVRTDRGFRVSGDIDGANNIV